MQSTPSSLETITDRKQAIAVAAILAQKIVPVASNPGHAAGGAPMLAEGLRIFESHERSGRAHRGFDGEIAIHVNGPIGAAHEGFRESLVRSELELIAG